MDIEALVMTFLEERNWHNPEPANLAKSISIEAAELLECFQWINPSIEETLENEKLIAEVSDELSDVLIYCIELISILGLDVDTIVKAKLSKASKKYDADAIKQSKSSDKYPNQKYYEIRDEHRRIKAESQKGKAGK